MANALLEINSASVDDYVEDDDEEALTLQPSSSSSYSSLCCCLPGIGLRRRARDGAARRHLLHEQGEGDEVVEESWLVRGAKKAKEASEVLAGPKWKNFIRSFSRKNRSQFYYDAESYALNFDDNIEANQGAAVRLEFSGR